MGEENKKLALLGFVIHCYVIDMQDLIRETYDYLDQEPDRLFDSKKTTKIISALDFCDKNDLKKEKAEFLIEFALMNKPWAPPGTVAHLWKHLYENMTKPVSCIKKEDLPYLKKRARKTKNKYLKAKYQYVLWTHDKKPKVLIESIGNFLRTAENHIASGYYKDDYALMPFCYRFALKLSLATGNNKKFDKIIKSMHSSIKKIQTQNHDRYVLELLRNFKEFNASLKRKITEVQTRKIIDGLIIISNKLSKKHRTSKTYHFERDFIDISQTLNHIINNEPEIKRLEQTIAESFEEEAQGREPLVKTVFLEDAAKIYAKTGNKQKFEEVKKEIGSANKKIKWKTISTKVKISTKPVKKLIEYYESLSDKEVVNKLAQEFSFYGTRERSEKLVDESKKVASFQHIIPKTIMDGAMSIKTISEEKEKDRYETKHQMTLENQLLREVFTKELFIKLENGKLKKELLLDKITKSSFNENTKKLISRGIKKHFQKEYIESIHILTLQIEPAIRDLLISKGFVPKVFSKEEFRDQELGGLLHNKEVKKMLGNEFAEYLDITLVDKLQENIRNDVAHGKMDIEKFQIDISATLILIILRLITFC